jgi:phage terminase large subunit
MAGIERTRVLIPYEPRPAFMPLHNRRERWGIMVAHRRAGKTVACINELNKAAITCPLKDGRYAYLAPFYNQAKDVAWTYLKRYSAPIPGCQAHESELRVDYPNGARARLYGADNADRLRGGYLDGVILDEYADMSPKVWPEIIRPMLADRKGWAVFIGTPKGRNSFHAILEDAKKDPDWFTLILKASESGLLAQDELAAAQKMMTAEQYAQEFECSFDAAIQGAYYAKELDALGVQKRIRSVPWEPSIPVMTGWDLGINDATVVWFAQIVGNEVRIIDHYRISGQSLTDTARHVLTKPYVYGKHYLPHDAEVRELMSATTRRETLESLGLRPIQVGAALPVDEGINAAKMLLPRCVFDEERCKDGIEALRHYRSEYDDKNRVFRPRPLHDWASHDADAFRELAQNIRAMTLATLPRKARLGTMA